VIALVASIVRVFARSQEGRLLDPEAAEMLRAAFSWLRARVASNRQLGADDPGNGGFT
jgi:hypothetical protein